MPKLRTKARSSDHIKRDFLDAIERIRSGRPQNPELRGRIQRGKTVELNVSTVALEAGRARTLIARANSAYPDVRNLILLESGEIKGPPRSMEEVISSLRGQLAATKSQLSTMTEHAQEHFLKRREAEEKATDLETENARLIKLVNSVRGFSVKES